MGYKIPVRIVSSIVLDGIVVRPGTVADVDRSEAERLLYRGKVELVTIAAAEQAEPEPDADAAAAEQAEPEPDADAAAAEQVEPELDAAPAKAKAKKGR